MATKASKVSATEANRQFSQLFRRAKAGETIVITDHGREVVIMAPKAAAAPRETERAEEDQAWRKLVLRLKSQAPLELGRLNRDELYDDD